MNNNIKYWNSFFSQKMKREIEKKAYFDIFCRLWWYASAVYIYLYIHIHIYMVATFIVYLHILLFFFFLQINKMYSKLLLIIVLSDFCWFMKLFQGVMSLNKLKLAKYFQSIYIKWLCLFNHSLRGDKWQPSNFFNFDLFRNKLFNDRISILTRIKK